MHIHFTDEMAIAHWQFRMKTIGDECAPAMTWMRCTLAFEKIAGHWRVIHEHLSVPYDPMTSMAVFSIED